MYEHRSSSISKKHSFPLNGTSFDNADAALISQRKQEIRMFKPGRCAIARKRLFDVFHMRKYFGAILGLTGVETLLVVCRLMLETESLRYPPGTTYKSLVHAELSLFCISLFILVLFVIEQPFKWWAFGSARYCKSVLLVLDALICLAAFSLNVYSIHTLSTRPAVELASAKQLSVCGVTHITHAPNTGWTFAVALGIMIMFRCWCIHGYVNKSIKVATAEKTAAIHSIRRELDDATFRIAQLESMLQDYTAVRPSKGSVRTPAANTRSTSRRSATGYDSRQSRVSQDNGQPV